MNSARELSPHAYLLHFFREVASHDLCEYSWRRECKYFQWPLESFFNQGAAGFLEFFQSVFGGRRGFSCLFIIVSIQSLPFFIRCVSEPWARVEDDLWYWMAVPMRCDSVKQNAIATAKVKLTRYPYPCPCHAASYVVTAPLTTTLAAAHIRITTDRYGPQEDFGARKRCT